MAALRSLWKLLINNKLKPQNNSPLSCSECFMLLEFLAETNADRRKNKNELEIKEKIKEHLQICPDCKGYYWQKLQELENYQKERQKKEIGSAPEEK